jgi:autotransporter-associated beta strand protein
MKAKQLTQRRKLKMKTKTNLKSFLCFLPATTAILLLFFAGVCSSFAGSATWLTNPANGDFNAANNWTAGGPPNGSADSATFATSNTRNLTITGATQLNGIVFNPGASAFTITNLTPTLTISGVGITNNSGIVQNFKPGPAEIDFINSASAGSSTLFTNAGNITFGSTATAGNASFINNGAIKFFNSTSAGSATFTNNAEILILGDSTAGAATFNNVGGGIIIFEVTETGSPLSDTPTAGSATITNTGGAITGAGGGFVVFNEGTSLGNALITNNGAVSGAFSGETIVRGDAATATLIANGGTGAGSGGLILFPNGGTGGTARVEVFGNAAFDISGHDAPGLTTGSIEGSGLVFLGARNLTVGTNNLSTAFTGLIQNGGNSGGTGGSLTKTGTGTLTLSGANTYTGATTVSAGTLLVSNATGSGTGTEAVNVNAGTLGGSGIISGPVTIGIGNGAGATLAPAGRTKKQATLTSQSALTFNADATYTYTFRAKANKIRTDSVVALGATIKSGATFSLRGTVQDRLQSGIVLTVISNTSGVPISGTFANLADGAIVNVNDNNLQASYSGGDGNDLTLTVVP